MSKVLRKQMLGAELLPIDRGMRKNMVATLLARSAFPLLAGGLQPPGSPADGASPGKAFLLAGSHNKGTVGLIRNRRVVARVTAV